MQPKNSGIICISIVCFVAICHIFLQFEGDVTDHELNLDRVCLLPSYEWSSLRK